MLKYSVQFCVLISLSSSVFGYIKNIYQPKCCVRYEPVLGDPSCLSHQSWTCADGSKIGCPKLCDGKSDCSDGSDETFKACRNFFCDSNSFRCAYGGCVNALSECNGISDCLDNSDEETPNCFDFANKTTKSGECEAGYFQCKSGQCIHEDEVCDGRANCVDSSDETEEECSSHYCHELNFQCSYGACILKADICNNILDCIDGSDESPEICPMMGQTSNLRRFKRQISPEQSFRTFDIEKYNKSLSKIKRLPNISQLQPLLNLFESQLEILNCLICSNGTGDCSNKTSTGINNATFSDEGYIFPIVTEPQPLGPLPTESLPTESRPTEVLPTEPTRLNLDYHYDDFSRFQNKVSEIYEPTTSLPELYVLPEISKEIVEKPERNGSCQLPKITGTIFFSGNEVKSDLIENGFSVNVTCLGNSKPIGTNAVYCIDGNFVPSLPKCRNRCSALYLNTLSVQAKCHNRKRKTIRCTPHLTPRTVALLSCKEGYRMPERPVKVAITCLSNGTWSSHVFKCEPICGVVSQISADRAGGLTTNIARVPWHAAIYESLNENRKQICGGTIINPTAIITAAHCFWDVTSNKLGDPANYVVAVGKAMRDFFVTERLSQVMEIKKIDVFENYNDYKDFYGADIAVLSLTKPIIFNLQIKPICIEYNLKNNERYVRSGVNGRVAGWGLTTSGGHPSPILKVMDIYTVDYHSCVGASPQEFKNFITSDKFCAGVPSGPSICVGDSGGGLVKRKTFSGNSSAYYLIGIVSTGPRKDNKCDDNYYSAYTNIHYFIQMLINYI